MSYGVAKYYEKLCPWDAIVEFCTLNGTFNLINREIAFRYGGDIFKRYDSFETSSHLLYHCDLYGIPPPLSEDVLKVPLAFGSASHLRDRSIRQVPTTINVGPVFPGLDRFYERSNEDLQKWSPLLFDMDIDDFVKVGIRRFCDCEERQLCDSCFVQILRPAMKTLDRYLQDMGFRSILFVYSGRRGFNCFVLDKRVWNWTADQRLGMLARLPSTLHTDKNVTKDPMHMIKPPLVPHQSTGVIACPIMDLDHFVPSQHGIHYSCVVQGQIDSWVGFLRERLRYACL